MVTFLNNSTNGWRHHIVILPRSCSMKSLGQSDINDNILMHALSMHNYEHAISQMFWKTQQRIGEILKFGDGQFQIDKSALPDGYFEPDVPTGPAEPCAGLPGPQDPPVSQDEDAPESWHESVEKEEVEEEEEVKGKDEVEQKIEADQARRERVAPWRLRALTRLANANRLEAQRDAVGPSSTEPPSGAGAGAGAGAGQRTCVELRRLHHCDPGSPGGGTGEYEQCDRKAVSTPSVSAASDTTTTSGLDLEREGVAESPAETAAEVNRNMIKDEVNLVLGRIFAGLAEQMGGNSPGNQRLIAGGSCYWKICPINLKYRTFHVTLLLCMTLKLKRNI